MQWISILDNLPPDDDPVLLLNGKNQIITIGFYMGEKRVMSKGFWFIDSENYAQELEGISHWKPLPKPPEKT